MIRLALFPAAILLAATAIPGGDVFAQSKTAPNQIEEYQQRESRWDDETAQRFIRKGAWREGVAYLGRALRLDRRNAAAARHLWNAVVSGGGDCNTLPDLALRQEAKINAGVFSPDGKRIVTVVNWSVQLWDAETGKRVGSEHAYAPSDAEGDPDAVFSPDSTCLLLHAIRDDMVRAWDCETGEPYSFSPRFPSLICNIRRRRWKIQGTFSTIR
jgi:hypothetical protein